MDFIDPFSVSKHCEVFLWAELSWRQKESPERFTNATGEVWSLSITGEIQALPAYVRSLTHSTKRFTLTDETRSTRTRFYSKDGRSDRSRVTLTCIV